MDRYRYIYTERKREREGERERKREGEWEGPLEADDRLEEHQPREAAGGGKSR